MVLLLSGDNLIPLGKKVFSLNVSMCLLCQSCDSRDMNDSGGRLPKLDPLSKNLYTSSLAFLFP